ncbi:hypothetical protein BC6307_08685 [Sutcliffiella cohnii]|uniref:VWFA domain-containing protein n=1 Tax=Sutcliffiella cohnii TaxID=33932 RepID=A0A223KPP0_9BACI|nr:VWA domain-containing protein [Sutcliffiella cohnii]AST91347.1 hypothetical protein BC6307_08685 [Sutcliffiella cohnii]
MGFLHPLYFLFTIFLLFVIMMYFFRKQYETKTIPSVLLWKEWMYEYEAQAWWKKLQHHLLMYLQLFILLLLIFALMKPFYETKGLEGEHIVFIFDTSASMGTLEVEGKTRLELSKEQAILLISQVDNQNITVLEAKSTPTLFNEAGNTRRDWLNTVESLQLSYAQSNITDSIVLAQGLIGESTGQIYVFTDQYDKRDELPTINEGISLHVQNVGSAKENVAVHTFGVAKRHDEIIGITTIYNESLKAKEVELIIYGDGEKINEQTIDVDAQSTVTVSLQDLTPAFYYEAVITGDEAYKLDNNQFTFLIEEQPSDVYLHSGIHPFVTKAVEIGGANTIHVSGSSNGENAGVHFVKGLDQEEWPVGPKVVFGHKGAKNPIEGEYRLDAQHRLLHLVDMQNVYIENAYDKKMEGLETIVDAEGVPLIQAGTYEGYPIVVLGFDIEDSDWPLHPSFPLFFYNTLQFLLEKSSLIGYFIPGEIMNYDVSPLVENLELVNGDHIIKIEGLDEPIELPVEPGLYTIRETYEDKVEEKYLYILLEDSEKTITPATSFSIGADNVEREEGLIVKDVSFIFLLLALFVLLIEWEVYRRAISS